ncbi:MAG TPA: hypothetical protein PKE29_17480 [Phycisphaerales bacterium]|nr:hypothetical protein [Phycisphaerales bacterium]
MESLTRTFTTIMEQRVLAALFLILILAIIMPIKELRYTLWGTPATATLLSIKPERRGRDTSERWKRIAYQFDDNGATRSESDLVTTNWPIPGFDKTGLAPPGTTVAIEYLPGTSSSRLKDHDDKSWFYGSAIVALLTTIAAACWWKFRNASKFASREP